MTLARGGVQAAPQLGQVTAGLAQIATAGATTTITQSSQRATIDWQSFSVAASETVLFQVPNSEGATLNRVIGTGASLIRGTVESNGILYLVNPNGIIFDLGSRVTANQFFASTANITTSDFMANRTGWSRFGDLGTDSIISSGTIKANAITLYGYDLTITDRIDATSADGKGGSVTLAAKNNIVVKSTAEISASGCATAATCTVVLHPTKTNIGGGKITIGGDFHGAGSMPTAANATVESGAKINANAGLRGQGGEVVVWADHHTEYKGSITAEGGATSGDGGFVEVSGKQTLDFQGTASTQALHGKTGTLLLDPATIVIVGLNPVSPAPGVSYILASDINTALGTSGVVINANNSTAVGLGLTPASWLTSTEGTITVNSAINGTVAGNGLLLVAGQIVINADITVNGVLSLTSTRASVWQDPNKAITADSITGASVDGFTLNGANKFNFINNITNKGISGISIRNIQVWRTYAGATLDGGTGSVSLLSEGFNLTLLGQLTVKGSYLRIDLGNISYLTGGTIIATGMNAYVTVAATGNNATLNLGTGSFTYVTDNRGITGPTPITNSTIVSITGFTPSATAGAAGTSGLVVTTSGDTTGKGVVYGGTVSIDGVTSGDNHNLRYIEGDGVKVTNPSTFSGSLMLVGSDGGIADSYGALGGVVIQANLKNLAGNLTLVQSGDAANGIVVHHQSAAVTLTTAGSLTLIQTGNTTVAGIFVQNSTLTAVGSITLIQSGKVVTNGIDIRVSTLTAAGELSLLQSGSAGSGVGIYLNSSGAGAGQALLLMAGASNFVTLKTNNLKLNLGAADYSQVTRGKVRIDLGTGIFVGGKILKTKGLDVFFTGATTGHVSKIDVGSGSFTYVTDRRTVIAPISLDNTTAATWSASNINGWSTGTGAGTGLGSANALSWNQGTTVVLGVSFTSYEAGGLTVLSTAGTSAKISGLGVVYGGTVTINGVTAASTTKVNDLRYIEGTGVAVTAASVFSGSLTLVGSGAEVTNVGTAGVLINANLIIGGDLTLVQSGNRLGNGITISGNLTATAGAMTLLQSGSAVEDGIAVNGTLTASGGMTLLQSGRVMGQGINVGNSTLIAGGYLSLLQTGSVGSSSDGIGFFANGTETNEGVSLAAGASSFVTLKTNNQKLSLNGIDNFQITGGRLRIDLGTGALVSANPAIVNLVQTTIPIGGYSLKARGLDVFFTGSIGTTTPTLNSAKIDVGSGSFTYVTDRRLVTAPTTLNNTTAATWSGTNIIGWSTGVATGLGSTNTTWTPETGGYRAGGLTVLTTAATSSKISGLGVVYGGTVDIQGIGTGAAKDLRYIEGTGVRVTYPSGSDATTGGSTFSGSLRLVGSGAGITVTAGLTSTTVGVYINANLTTTNGGDLTLVQSDITFGNGISISNSTVTAGGALSLLQSGSVATGYDGINFDGVLLAAGASSFVTLKTNNKDLSIGIPGSIAGGYEISRGKVRIDLGIGAFTSSSGKTLKAPGLDVFFTGAKTGNSAKIDVGSGSFTYVTDRRTVTAPTILNNLTSATGTNISWSSVSANELGSTTTNWADASGGYSAGGLTVLTPTANKSRITGLGVVYGGTVDIRGIGSGGAKDLRYIEGTGVSVTIPPTPLNSIAFTASTGGSTFSGSLTLVGSGAGITSGITAGIFILANLTTTVGDLTLVQSGNVATGYGFYVNNSTLTAGGAMTLVQSGSARNDGILVISGSTLTAVGSLTLTQSGGAGESGINVSGSILTAGGSVTLSQSGSAGESGIQVQLSSILTAGGAMILSQTGSAGGIGIAAKSTILTAGGELSLLQSGSVGSGKAGIYLGAIASSGVSLKAGASNFVTLKTNNQNLWLSANPTSDKYLITRGKLRIDLGTGAMVSDDGDNNPATVIAPPHTLNARGLEVFFTGATTGHTAKIDVGSGSFTFVNDKRGLGTAAKTLTNSSTVADWGTGFGGLINGTANGGLTVITTGGDSTINHQGVVYGGTVTIDDVKSTDAASNLRYIEGTGVKTFTNPSSFSGSLTLVGNGAGISGTIASGTFTGGVLILANLTTTNGGDITLVQSGNVPLGSGNGIYIGSSTVMSDGAMTLVQLGSAGGVGIMAKDSTLTAIGAMTLVKSGSAEQLGIYVYGSTLTAGGDLSLLQSGSVGSAYGGIGLAATDSSQKTSLASGAGNFVTFKTNNDILVLNVSGNSEITRGKVRIDLGTGAFLGGGFTLNASSLDVYYTGASTDNTSKIKAKSFTVVTKASGNKTLGDATAMTSGTYANYSWVLDGSSASVNPPALPATKFGVGYATDGVLTITAVSHSAGYSYLEGATISGTVVGGPEGLGTIITTIIGKEIYARAAIVAKAALPPLTITGDILWDGTGLTGVNAKTFARVFADKGASGLTLTIGSGSKLRLLNVGAVSSLLSFSNIVILSGGEFIIGGQGVQLSGGVTIDSSAGGILTVNAGSEITVNGVGWSPTETGLTLKGSLAARAIKLSGGDLTLSGIVTLTSPTKKLLLDLGSNRLLSGTLGGTLNAFGVDVIVNKIASSDNSATISVRAGSFSMFRDLSSTVTTAVTITATGAKTSEGSVTDLPTFRGSSGSRTIAGLTISGNTDAKIIRLGVKFGGTVSIEGVTPGSTEGITMSGLYYIEGTGVATNTAASTFSGSLTLVGSGAGINGIGVRINANLTTTNGGDLTLVQSGNSTGNGIDVSGNLTASGAMTLTQSQSGGAGNIGISLTSSNLRAGGAMTLTQSGSARQYGIVFRESTLRAGGDLSLLQSGSVISGIAGVFLGNIEATVRGFSLAAGASNFVTVKTNNNNLWFEGNDKFQISGGRLRIDLGTGAFVGGSFTLNAIGLDVYFTGSRTSGQIKAGSFTVVTKTSGNQPLAEAVAPILSDYSGWVTDSATNKPITSIGAGFATNGVLSISAATSGGYSYLEGTSIVGAAAAFLGTKITTIVGKEIYAGYVPAPENAIIDSPLTNTAPIQSFVPNRLNNSPIISAGFARLNNNRASSGEAPSDPRLTTASLIMFNLKANMNVTIPKPDDEGQTESNYLIPLTGNSDLWE